MTITDKGIVMLAKDSQFTKAKSPMAVTESGIATLTTWLQFSKASAGISVREDGMLTFRRPSAWIASFVAASTSFLEYMPVTSDSACNTPADSSVWSSSTSNPSAKTFTRRIWRSMGSSQCFFSQSIAFNSSMVLVGMTSRMRTPPSKVFTFTWWTMAARLENLQNAKLCPYQLTTDPHTAMIAQVPWNKNIISPLLKAPKTLRCNGLNIIPTYPSTAISIWQQNLGSKLRLRFDSGTFSQIGMKIQNIRNHHLDILYITELKYDEKACHVIIRYMCWWFVSNPAI